MDTSEKYITMCQMAKEIQKYWLKNRHAGDWVFDPGTLPYEITVYGGWYVLREDGWIERVGEIDNETWLGDEIWLPRQDQLQKIAFPLCVEQGFSGLPSRSYQYIWCLHEFMLDHSKISGACRKGGRCEWYPNQMSLEQWWLMLIMEKKYNKVWDNKKEEWISQKNV